LDFAVLVEVVESDTVEGDVDVFGYFGGEPEVEAVVNFLEIQVLVVGEEYVAGLEIDIGADVFVEFS